MAKKTHRSFFALLFVVLMFPFSGQNMAAGDAELIINGLDCSDWLELRLIDNRSYAPLQGFVQALGTLSEQDGQVFLINENSEPRLSLALGTDAVAAMAEEVVLIDAISEPLPLLIDQQVWLPVRSLAERIGAQVQWQEAGMATMIDGTLASQPRRVVIHTPVAFALPQTGLKIASERKAESWTLPRPECGDEVYIGYSVDIPILCGLEDRAFQDAMNAEFMAFAEALIEKMHGVYQQQLNSDTRYHASDEATFRVLNEQPGYLALMIEGYDYQGGAHGNPYRIVSNLDLNRSLKLKLSDLFRDGSDYEPRLLDIMNEQRQQHPSEYEGVEAVTSLPEQDFYLTEDELVIFYPPYELAPYARGYVEFRIPLQQIDDILSETFPSNH